MMRDIRNRKEVSTMNTLEATVSMMKQLPENDLLKIQAFVRLFFPDSSNPFVPLTEEETMHSLPDPESTQRTGILWMQGRYPQM